MAVLRLLGNKAKAGGYLPWARAKLGELRRLLNIQGLHIGLRRYKLSDADILVTKNFRNELIQIRGISAAGGVDVLFLITNSNVAYGWAIKSNGASLIPTTFDFSYISEISYIDDPTGLNDNDATYLFPSTCKSSSDMTKHVYAIMDHAYIPGIRSSSYPCNYGAYGVYQIKIDNVWVSAIRGIASCWQPNGWSLGVEDFTFSVDKSSDFIAGAKRSYQLDSNNNIIKDLKILEIGIGVGQIEYNTKEGHKIGSTFNYDEKRHIHAVLSPTLIIGVDYNSYSSGTWINRSDNSFIRDCMSSSAALLDGEFDNRDRYEYKFGSVILEYALGTGWYWIDSHFSKSCPCEGEYFDDDLKDKYWINHSQGESYGSTNKSSIEILDYDHENGDETFVCVYRKKDAMLAHYSYSTLASKKYSGFESGSSILARFYIAYRNNGGSLQKEEITFSSYGDYTYYGAGTGSVCDGPLMPVWCGAPDENITYINGMQGSRVSDISCQLTGDYIVYSYAIQDYSGPVGENHIDDWYDDNWTYNHRVIGVIHRESGLRSEHIVDDILLGNFSEDFDTLARYAIGLHKG